MSIPYDHSIDADGTVKRGARQRYVVFHGPHDGRAVVGRFIGEDFEKVADAPDCATARAIAAALDRDARKSRKMTT